jgi:hypothetical protein
MKKLAIALALAGGATIAPQAEAAVQLNGSCLTDNVISVGSGSTIDSCIGWYTGNALSGSPADNLTINAALTALGYSGPTIDYSSLPPGNILAGLGGSSIIDFGQVLNGIVYIGIHFGGSAPGDEGNNTGFYKIDASDLETIQINPTYAIGSSNAVLLSSTPTVAVPEPATWALMLLGFAAIGFAMRRNTKQTVAVRYNFA